MPLIDLCRDLVAARRVAAARPVVDLSLIRAYTDLAAKAGAIAARRLAGRA